LNQTPLSNCTALDKQGWRINSIVVTLSM